MDGETRRALVRELALAEVAQATVSGSGEDWQTAEQALTGWLEVSPGDRTARQERAGARERLQQWEGAREDWLQLPADDLGALGQQLERLDIQARFDDADIVHLITENLQIVGNAGGPL